MPLPALTPSSAWIINTSLLLILSLYRPHSIRLSLSKAILASWCQNISIWFIFTIQLSVSLCTQRRHKTLANGQCFAPPTRLWRASSDSIRTFCRPSFQRNQRIMAHGHCLRRILSLDTWSLPRCVFLRGNGLTATPRNGNTTTYSCAHQDSPSGSCVCRRKFHYPLSIDL